MEPEADVKRAETIVRRLAALGTDDIGGHENCQMSVGWFYITPDIAEAFLLLSAGNRSIRHKRVAGYSKDISEDKWHPSHQGMAFNSHIRLCDGHHRCHAIIKAGRGAWSLVFFDVYDESEVNIDSMLARSTSDACLMSSGDRIPARAFAVAKVIESLPWHARSEYVTRETEVELYHRYKDAIDFSVSHTSHVLGATRAVRALVARASYHVELDILQDFCKVLTSGMPSCDEWKVDSAAIVFHKWLSKNLTPGGPTEEVDRYCKGQACLSAFIKQQPMYRISSTRKDLFPLTSE